MRPKLAWDFHDYMELRRAMDRGEAPADAAARLAALEKALPVPFAAFVPRMVDPVDVPDLPYPRGMTSREVRFLFEAREEYARLGATRRERLAGHDLATEAEGLKDWLDFVEEERKAYKHARQSLRTLDRKIYAAFTGERRMPSVSANALAPLVPATDLGRRAPPAPARVRRARGEDAPEWCALIREAAEERVYIATEPEEVRSPEAQRELIERAKLAEEFIAVAEAGGRVIGTLGVHRGARAKVRHTAEVGICVARAWRGLGVGRALMDAAEAWAREQGLLRLHLSVYTSNLRARRLYERLGYRVEGVQRGQQLVRGEPVDLVLMGKWLGP